MKKVITIVLDGFGFRTEEKGNAYFMANMPHYKEFYDNNPHTTLYASEENVGLLPGQQGNSEIGHKTIGAGRVIKSNMTLIKEFFEKEKNTNEEYQKLLQNTDKKVHLMGLFSDGNVHSSLEHFLNMYDNLVKSGFKKIYFHLITDGRDTKVNVAYEYIKILEEKINENKVGSISTICGRYYAMDRDKNWERTKLYYDLITKGIGIKTNNIKKAIESLYNEKITDEFIKPLIIDNDGIIKEDDVIIWMNYRSDRAKQILSCFNKEDFSEFKIKDNYNVKTYSFFEIDKDIKTINFLKDRSIENPIGLYFSKLGLKQARIGESEKYAHVTYFLDGEYEGKIDNCDKFHIPSPSVKTYDLKPEMSAVDVTKKAIECMQKDYDFIFMNYANPDMVGHTGNMEATVKALNVIDLCLGKLFEAAEDNFYTIFLLADHGNCDTMINDDGSPCTTHSLAKVPFVVNDKKVRLLNNGDLSNVAPTILDYMDIAIPKEMTSDTILVDED